MTPDLVGYAQCDCGTFVPDHVAHLTAGRCVPCHRSHLEEELKPIEVVLRGQRICVTRNDATPAERARNRRKNLAKAAKRKTDPAHRRRKHLSEHAKRRALRRLKALYSDVYDLLLADEREKMGLPGFTHHRATASAAASQAYETLEHSGVHFHENPVP